MGRDTIKFCPECLEAKMLTKHNWHKATTNKDGWNRICKICKNARSRASYQKNKSKLVKATKHARCSRCNFEDTCRARIWEMEFITLCSPQSPRHDLFLQQYEDRKNGR